MNNEIANLQRNVDDTRKDIMNRLESIGRQSDQNITLLALTSAKNDLADIMKQVNDQESRILDQLQSLHSQIASLQQSVNQLSDRIG